MKIDLSSDAEQYIIKNGYCVMVLLGKMTGCCGGTAPMPQVDIGSPHDLSRYEENIIGDITVFIDKNITAEKIEISLDKLLWIRKLSVNII